MKKAIELTQEQIEFLIDLVEIEYAFKEGGESENRIAFLDILLGALQEIKGE